ncbi:MAG: hypothetical protein IBX67_07590 [Dehalococcoidia bacterium]|nr:hypothetical protein [Dehalococcoidia bacterium]
MQKCPLCGKKIVEEGRFCSQCGWDLAGHELTPLQVARIQDELADVRHRSMHWHVAAVGPIAIGILFMLVAMAATFEVVPARLTSMMYLGWPLILAGIAFGFLRDRHRKRQDRLRMMLRDRR